jgi:hypothetical protein
MVKLMNLFFSMSLGGGVVADSNAPPTTTSGGNYCYSVKL